MRQAKALVTGGAGFIGSHIAEELAKRGIEVIVVDDFSSGKEENLKEAKNLAVENGCRILVRKLDLSTASPEEILGEYVDYVFHCAAKISITESMENPIYHSHQNILGTINLLEACAKYKIDKLIYSSSAAIYGDLDDMPLKEIWCGEPISHYGFTKRAGEDLVKMYGKLYGINYAILRYFNVYGPRQSLSGYAAVIPAFINGILNNKKLIVYGDGKQTRSFVYVKDIARINIEMATKTDTLVGNQIYNVCDEKYQSVESLLSTLNEVFEKKIEFSYVPERKGEIKHSIGSANKLNSIGIKTSTSFVDGLRETIDFYKNGK